jgi:hypothetical protein
MNNIHDIPDEEGDEWQDDDGDFTYGDVIDGAVPIDISHGGGEMQDMAQALSDDLHGKARRWARFVYALKCIKQGVFRKRQDTRYRSDVVQRRVLGFRAQMKEMVDAYMAFSAAQGEHGMAQGPVSPSDDMVENEFRVMVVDVFGAVFCFKWNSSNAIARYLYCGCTYPQYRHIYRLLPGWAGLDPLLTMEAQAGCVNPCPRDVPSRTPTVPSSWGSSLDQNTGGSSWHSL